MAAWDSPQEGESSKAYEAFCFYRDLGPSRSIDKAFRVRQSDAKIAPRIWDRWAAENDWKRRAEAFDLEQDRKKRLAIDRAQREEVKRFQQQLRADNEDFAKASRVSLAKALYSLEKLSEEKLSARDAASLLNSATTAIKTANEIQAQWLGLGDLIEALDNDADSDAGNERPFDTRETDTE